MDKVAGVLAHNEACGLLVAVAGEEEDATRASHTSPFISSVCTRESWPSCLMTTRRLCVWPHIRGFPRSHKLTVRLWVRLLLAAVAHVLTHVLAHHSQLRRRTTYLESDESAQAERQSPGKHTATPGVLGASSTTSVGSTGLCSGRQSQPSSAHVRMSSHSQKFSRPYERLRRTRRERASARKQATVMVQRRRRTTGGDEQQPATVRTAYLVRSATVPRRATTRTYGSTPPARSPTPTSAAPASVYRLGAAPVPRRGSASRAVSSPWLYVQVKPVIERRVRTNVARTRSEFSTALHAARCAID